MSDFFKDFLKIGTSWRKFNKIVFALALGLAVFGCVPLIILLIAYVPYGVWLAIGSILLLLISFSAWGMLLEYFDNIAQIKEKVCMSTPTFTPCESEPEIENSDWECIHCGSLNKINQDYCKDCGKYK